MNRFFDIPWDSIGYEAESVLEDTLNANLASDLARDIADDTVNTLKSGTVVRYAVFDPFTGETASVQVYKTWAEAEEASRALPFSTESPLVVGTLLLDK